MKKLMTLMMALAMVLALSVPAFAAETPTDLSKDTTSGTTVVKYGVDEKYTVTIPDDVTLSTTGVEKAVTASDVLIADKKQLKVSMASLNGFKVKYGDSNLSEIAYTISKKIGSDPATSYDKNCTANTDYEILTVGAGVLTGEVNLTFATTNGDIGGATKAGPHTDTLTFTCSVEDVA